MKKSTPSLTQVARRWRATLVCLFLCCLLSACEDGSSSPTAPEPPPQGVANGTAFSNLLLARTLQDEAAPGTLLVGVGAPGILRNGRLEPGNFWSYSFADIDVPGTMIYTWNFDVGGNVTMSGPVLPNGPFSGIDIESALGIDSGQAVALAESLGGAEYFRQHPNASVSIGYLHFASQVRAQIRYSDLSPGSNGCEISIFLHATTGDLIVRDIACLSE